nr:TldD/PmbA family protein [Bacteroidota bacterium]
MIKQSKFLALVLLTFLFLPAKSQDDVLLNILKEELQYEFNELQKEEYPPYFMAYSASDSYSISMVSTNGCITQFSENKIKRMAPTIKAGSYDFDNTHITDQRIHGMDFRRNNFCLLPKENDTNLVKYKIWEITNNLYKDIVKLYVHKKENAKESDSAVSGDFSKQSPEKYYEPKPADESCRVDANIWKDKLNKYTSVFKNSPDILLASGSFNYTIDREYFVSTEETEIVQNHFLCTIRFFITGKSSSGEFIPYTHAFYAFTPQGLTDDSEIMAELIEVRNKIIAISKAPKAEPFSGPAILSPGAAGVFFHEILGHRIEGHRMNLSFNSKTFKEKIDEPVLNKDLSVYSDPTISNYGEKDLVGYYKFDNQGIKAQKVIIIQDGILKRFLMSRKPIEGFNQSNGHGRGDLGTDPVARQSNLFVTTKNPKSFSYLKKKLIKECKKQKVEYGYYFKTVSGGYTNTMNFAPDFFNIIPLEVYRINVDGRPDELVTGVNLIGTPLIIFSEIIAAGDRMDTFSGICGAESGGIPVSTVAPAILVRKIETQNQFSFKPEWPILPDPEIIDNHK